MSNDNQVELARRLFALVGEQSLDEAEKMWHEDVIEDFVAVGVMRGKAEARRFFEELFAAFPDFELVPEHIVGDERGAFISWRATGTFSGSPFQGIAANGARLEQRGVDRMQFEDGLLRRNTIYYDGAGFARAVGMLPAQGSGAEGVMKGAFNAVTAVRKRIGV